MASLLAQARERDGVVIAVIDGGAGVGKTALALHWAHRISGAFPDGQLHVNLRGFDPGEPMDPGQALHGFLQALGVAAPAIPVDLDAKAALYRSLLAGKRMLIVLDNARSSDQVRPLLPAGSGAAVLITSRRRLDSLVVREGAHRVPLDALSTADAVRLLAERAGAARIGAEPEAARELARLCARLPLALSIVAARAAAQPALPLRALVHELGDERNRLDALDLGDTDLSLRTVFSWSYHVLSPDAARLFRVLGVHPGPEADPLACAAVAGPRAREQLRELTAAHLITEYVPGRFRFHDLLRVYAAEKAAEPEHAAEAAAAAEAFLTYYLRAALLADRLIQPVRDGVIEAPEQPGVDLPDITSYDDGVRWFATEAATLLELITFAADRGFASHAWKLAWACTTFLRRSGRWTERVAVHRTALAATRRAGDRRGQAVVLRHLAQAVARLGWYEEAIGHLALAAQLYEELRDDVAAVPTHLAFSRVFEAQGNHAEALAHAERAWALVRDGDNRFGQVGVLATMGRQLFLLGRYDEALPICEQALKHYAALSHPEGEAAVLRNIGQIEQRLGRHRDAVAHYRRSLELDRLLGDRYWEAHVLSDLGDAYLALGDSGRARQSWRESIAVLRELNHPEVSRVAAKLSALPALPPEATFTAEESLH